MGLTVVIDGPRQPHVRPAFRGCQLIDRKIFVVIPSGTNVSSFQPPPSSDVAASVRDYLSSTARALRDAPRVVALFAVVAPVAAALDVAGDLLVVGTHLLGILVVAEGSTVRTNASGSAGVRLLVAVVAIPVAGFVVGFGLLFFVVPGVYLWVRLYLVIPAVIVDGDGPVEAVRTSWRLTGGRVVPVAVVAVGVALITLLFGIACLLATGNGVEVTLDPGAIPGTFLAETVMLTVGGPLTVAASTAIYLQSREQEVRRRTRIR